MVQEELVTYFMSGRLAGLPLGMPLAEVSRLLGSPDGVTGPLPALHAYGDLQLGRLAGTV
ncbi:hypothetical protein ACWCV9_07740 [Streptomyces sp. NPDC001606]